ncbi:Interferon-induced, double-stranded RNA-activated protein kinase [Folsomia candida]|uniref:non-specific serine/threonine protein kinase n=1 Tax=Folsomia candida TaxID=158441 RepID=A0A226D7N2_FOLCA|nr:Interferon-induced, double-stranded RNA-activated protein kinase [Folsomia candida]
MFPRNPRNWELRNHLVPIKCIGGGSFGTVWEAYHSIDKGSYAIKTVGISATLKLQNYKICQEVRLLQSLDHTNIVKYHDSWVEGPNIENLLKKEEKFDQTGSLPDDYHGDSELSSTQDETNFLFIQMELCDTDLAKWLKNLPPDTNLETRPTSANHCILDISHGLKYIHQRGIIHRDLKPENIFGTPGLRKHWKIGDFGLSTKYQEQDLQSHRGTNLYASPEMANRQKYTELTDIFSAGLIFLEIIHPFDPTEKRSIFYEIKSGNTKYLETTGTHNLVEIIWKMLHIEANLRPSASQIVDEFELLKQNNNRKVSGKRLTYPYPIFTPSENGQYDGLIFGVGDVCKTFVGRVKELRRLEELYKSGEALITLTGMGGIGKSELAKKFAFDLHKTHGNPCVWLDGENIEQSLNKLCKNIGIPKTGNDLDTVTFGLLMVKRLAYKSKNQLLLIIDNVDEINKIVNDLIKGLRAEKMSAVTLVTSRNVNVFKSAEKTVKLHEFTELEGIALLKSQFPTESVSDIAKLCELLDNFPLALQQAVGFIKQSKNVGPLGESFKIKNLLEIYERKKEQILNYQLDSIYHAYPSTCLITWDISMEKIRNDVENGEAADKLMHRLAFLEPDGIDLRGESEIKNLCHIKSSSYETLRFLQYFDKERTEDAVTLLKLHSLIKSENNVVSIHRLVQEVTRLKLEIDVEHEILRQMGEVILKHFDTFEPHDFNHVIRLWHHIQQDEVKFHNFMGLPMTSLAPKMDKFPMYKAMREVLIRGLGSLQRLEKYDKLGYISLYAAHKLARALQFSGRYDLALEKYRQIYSRQCARYGLESEESISSGKAIAVNLWYLKRYKESTRQYKQLLAACARAKLWDAERTSLLLKSDLSILLVSQGKLSKAAIQLGEVLEYLDRKGKGKDPVALMLYGNALFRLGHFRDALKAHEESVHLHEAVWGPYHCKTVASKLSYAPVLFILNKGNVAIEMLENIMGHVDEEYADKIKELIRVMKMFKPLFWKYSPLRFFLSNVLFIASRHSVIRPIVPFCEETILPVLINGKYIDKITYFVKVAFIALVMVICIFIL